MKEIKVLTNKQLALVAARWWAEKICKPKLENDNMSVDSIARAMSLELAKDIDDNSKGKFITTLADSVEIELNLNGYHRLMVDYDPSILLENAATESGISKYYFPLKTTMDISNKHLAQCVKVFFNNGKTEIVYANAYYYNNKIKSNNYSILSSLNSIYSYKKENTEYKNKLLLLGIDYDNTTASDPYELNVNVQNSNDKTVMVLGKDINLGDTVKFTTNGVERSGVLDRVTSTDITIQLEDGNTFEILKEDFYDVEIV